MEIKFVHYKKYNEALKDIRNELIELQNELFPGENGMLVEVIADTNYGQCIEAGVNWSALGLCSVEETESFAYLLKRAAYLAKNFKYNGYVVDWNNN